MQDELLQTETQEKANKVIRSYRIPPDLDDAIKATAANLNVSEAWVIEMYLGASLGIREFPEIKPPATFVQQAV